MKKTVKVIMLPTKDITGIVLHSTGLDPHHHYPSSEIHSVKNIGGTSQHLYLVSDNEIKEGDWFLVFLRNKWEIMNSLPNGGFKKEAFGRTVCKIIATTNSILTISDKYTIYDILPQIPESFIKVYCKVNGNIDEVQVEMIWEQSCVDAPSGHIYSLKTREDNTVIIHQAKIYTKEEVEKLCKDAWRVGFNTGQNDEDSPSYQTAEDWLKDNI